MSNNNFKLRRKLLKLTSFLPILPIVGLTRFRSSFAEKNNTNLEVNTVTIMNSTDWASGGTDLITVDYPTDDIFTHNNTCKITRFRKTTRGPCYFKNITGEDISLGLSGLPMMLCLRFVDSDCEPLVGHTIEIWHCDTVGLYSGDTSKSTDSRKFSSRYCTNNNEKALKSTWYRGQLITNSNGRVNFKTHFPGWYPSRSVHIHFAVSDPQGKNGFISQLGFSDLLATEVLTTQPLYKNRGNQDTSLAQDEVFPRRKFENFLLNTKRNTDNTMLAYQTIQLD